uniref:Cytochrome c n=1 Tax=Magnetococcus massalia (strain MO-1) TaxID=451514 RepID=A0A1S7LF90_MAGMO|nr:conserved exported protein of unknown function [Candidatus Magnetococcus massalia]
MAKIRVMLFGVFAFLLLVPGAEADDRELISLSPELQGALLSNMRDHLNALHTVIGLLAKGENEGAAQVADERLGMSSMAHHGHHIGKHVPASYRAMGTRMHQAGSSLITVVQDASMEEPDVEAQMIFGALEELVESCDACHLSFRIK